MSRTERVQPPLITTARFGKSLDTSQRTRRYVVTMVFRVLCFLGCMVAPLPWNVGLMLLAALLPGVAVLLANAVDDRTPPAPTDDEPAPLLALTMGDIVRGEVDEEPGR